MPALTWRAAQVFVGLFSAAIVPISSGQDASQPGAVVKAPRAASILSDDQIRAILKNRVEQERRGVGIVVGIVTESGTRIISYGEAAAEGAAPEGFDGDESARTRPLDGDTVFEIGSITKTFTASILAGMAIENEVALDDPVSKFLPSGVRVPRRGGKDITLQLLAQHMSGLPRMADNFIPSNRANPYADYDAQHMYAWLGSLEPPNEPGEKVEYSNIGYGLLGHALALKAGTSYETLLRERITRPMGMSDTVVSLTPELKSRLAQGHDDRLQPAANWDLDVMAGAGAIRSTVNDMLRYCAANAGVIDSPLNATFAHAQALKHPLRNGNENLGSLAWSSPMPLPHDRRLWWHNGGTGGYRSFLGFDREARVGVVVLSNSSIGIDDLAIHIIEPDWPLDVRRIGTKLPREALDRLVGVYEIEPGSYRTITRYRDRLFLQRTGQRRRELKAESDLVFFNDELRVTVTFEPAADGRISKLVLKSGPTESPASRVDRPVDGKPLFEQDPATFDGLAGTYSEAPDFVYTVRRDGERLLVSVTGQAELEVFPIGPDHFTYLEVDAELKFSRGADGNGSVIRRTQGRTVASAPRLK